MATSTSHDSRMPEVNMALRKGLGGWGIDERVGSGMCA